MIRIFNHFVPTVASVLLVTEFLFLTVAMYATLRLGPLAHLELAQREVEGTLVSAALISAVMIFSMAALGMYRFDLKESGIRHAVARVVAVALIGFSLMSLLATFVQTVHFSKDPRTLATLAMAVVAILVLRSIVIRSSDLKLLKSKVIFVGGGSLAQECGQLVANSAFSRKYEIVGFVPLPSEDCCIASSHLLPSGESLAYMVQKYEANEIVVSVKHLRDGSIPITDLLACKLNGVKITAAATFFEREACQIRVDSVQPSWFVFGDGFNQSSMRRFWKRAFDVTVSLLIFIVTLPVMLITALYIYLEDRGPVLYRQDRVGKDGHTFMILKFRSMRNNAESAGKPQWAQNDDPRVTRVGRIIRKLRIDELPQLINVLAGEMSLVGPRPERPYFVDELVRAVPFYGARHCIKPGITGFAQVRYPYGASVEDAVRKLQYDLYYVKNNSLFLDLLILIDTIQVVLLRRGSR